MSLKLNSYISVVDGPHSGASGRVDYVDVSGERALIDFGGSRKGGLIWVPLQHLPKSSRWMKLKCDLCTQNAVYEHPEGGLRCAGCLRPE